MVSVGVERRVEIGWREEGDSWRFEVVVRIRRAVRGGRRAVSWEVRSAIVVDASVGRERVGGSERPGNEVRRMLIICGAMMLEFRVVLTSCCGVGWRRFGKVLIFKSYDVKLFKRKRYFYEAALVQV